jgi:hypothetical protein
MLPNNSVKVASLAGSLPVALSQPLSYEVIDAAELGRRWSVGKTWILERTRNRATDPIPCVRLGRYVRFEWGSPALLAWWAKRRTQ